MLDDFEPSVSVSISYPSKHKAVNLGNSIKPKHVTSQPVFSIYASEATPTATRKSNATYVLALTDPDATSRSDPVKAQMCHWIATNITVPLSSSVSLDPIEVFSLSAFSKGSASSGIQELMPYLPPTPPPKTGDHRYVFVVLTRKSDVNHEQLLKPKDRPHWGYGHVGDGVREWAKENHLTVVGESAKVICVQAASTKSIFGLGQ